MKTTLSHLIVAAGIAALLGAGYWYWYGVILAQQSRAEELQVQIDSKTRLIGRATSARTLLAERSSDEEMIIQYFIPEADAATFIEDLEARGHTLGTTVSVLSVTTDTSDSDPTLSLSLTITGPFSSVLRTVGAIEYAPYNLTISSLSFGRDTDKQWHADLKLLVALPPTP